MGGGGVGGVEHNVLVVVDFLCCRDSSSPHCVFILLGKLVCLTGGFAFENLLKHTAVHKVCNL